MDEIDRYVDIGEPDMVKHCWKMIFRRKTALQNIREWRTRWMGIIQHQVMKSAYKDHGPNWRKNGIEQGESFDEWWIPVFEVENTLYKGIA